jgi:hypothetical protein
MGLVRRRLLACLFLLLAGPVTAQDQTSAYTHNGSDMRVVWSGEEVTITYVAPRAGLRPEGVAPGTLLFRGMVEDGYLSGLARIFRAGCGVLDYFVYGDFEMGQDFVLSGAAPVLAPQGCTIVNNVHDDPNSTLVFRADRTSTAPNILSGPLAPGTRLCVAGAETGSALNLRVGPDTGYAIIGQVPSGACDAVAVSVATRGWMAVQWQGQFGWASVQFLHAGN